MGCLVVDGDQFAAAPGADPEPLLGVGAVADAGEHLRPGEDQFDRPSDRACGEYRQEHVLPDAQARPEPAAAPTLGQDTDAVLAEVLGLSTAAIGRLHDAGTVAGPT